MGEVCVGDVSSNKTYSHGEGCTDHRAVATGSWRGCERVSGVICMGQSESETYLHIPYRTAEFEYPHGDAPHDAASERILEEVGKPASCLLALVRLLQFLPGTLQPESDTRDGGRHYRPCLVYRRTPRLKLQPLLSYRFSLTLGRLSF